MKRVRETDADSGDEAPTLITASPPLPCRHYVERIPTAGPDIYAVRLCKPHVSLEAVSGVRLVVGTPKGSVGVGEAFPLRPADRWFGCTTLLDRVYHAYETHTLALDEDETTVLAIYVAVESAPLGPPRVHVEPEAHWMTVRFGGRYVALPWFPPDVDPRRYGLKVDSKRVPQRSPLWLELRGIGGTKASTLMGYWVPTEADDPDWTLDGPKTFSAAAQDAMRLGTQSESVVHCGLLADRPNVTLSAVGWCEAPSAQPGKGRVCPRGWGASPDALIHDPGMTWDQVPADIRKYHVESDWDITLGVLEIKTSRRATALEPYFLPQIYMEMLATGRLWCDLVRYRPHPDGRVGDGPALKGGTAHVYRIHRHKPTEELIVSLMKIALAAPPTQLRALLLRDERWVQARAYFKAVARQTAHTTLHIDGTHEAEWRAHRESLFDGGQ